MENLIPFQLLTIDDLWQTNWHYYLKTLNDFHDNDHVLRVK